MKIAKYVAIFSAFLFAGFGGLVLLSPSEIEYTVNKDINAPLNECWETMTNFNEATNWIAGLTTVQQIKGSDCAEGSEYKLTYGEDENAMVMNVRITVFDPQKQLASRGTVENFLDKQSVTTFQLVDSTTTRLSTRVKMKALSFRMKLFMNNQKSFKQAEAENLDNLQSYISGN